MLCRLKGKRRASSRRRVLTWNSWLRTLARYISTSSRHADRACFDDTVLTTPSMSRSPDRSGAGALKGGAEVRTDRKEIPVPLVGYSELHDQITPEVLRDRLRCVRNVRAPVMMAKEHIATQALRQLLTRRGDQAGDLPHSEVLRHRRHEVDVRRYGNDVQVGVVGAAAPSLCEGSGPMLEEDDVGPCPSQQPPLHAV